MSDTVLSVSQLLTHLIQHPCEVGSIIFPILQMRKL